MGREWYPQAGQVDDGRSVARRRRDDQGDGIRRAGGEGGIAIVNCRDGMGCGTQLRRQGRLGDSVLVDEPHRRLRLAVDEKGDRAGRRGGLHDGDSRGQRDHLADDRRIRRYGQLRRRIDLRPGHDLAFVLLDGRRRGRGRRAGHDLADLVGVGLGEVDVAVGTGRDAGGAAIGRRDHELRERRAWPG